MGQIFAYNGQTGGQPANRRRLSNIVLMLAQRLRRRSNIKTTLAVCLVFAGQAV